MTIPTYIITLVNNNLSLTSALRCKDSILQRTSLDPDPLDPDPGLWAAFGPNNCNVDIMFCDWELDSKHFIDNWSRRANAMACFLSHCNLWRKCRDLNEPVIILEHDAVMVTELPCKDYMNKYDIYNLGKPSYGRFNTITSKDRPYEGKLFSTSGYLKGAHAYYVTPVGAQKLLDKAKQNAKPVDLFISDKDFNIGESIPWAFEAHDSFSTIQKKRGCIYKHKYNDEFKIIEA